MVAQAAVRLPGGTHVVEAAAKREGIAVVDLNATLRSASVDGKKIRFRYASDSRAIVRFDRKPVSLEVDGQAVSGACVDTSDCAVMLPRGEHEVSAQ